MIDEVKWWARWWIRYFPGHLYCRLRYCLRGHRGPLYDGYACCLTCAAPWFRRSL